MLPPQDAHDYICNASQRAGSVTVTDQSELLYHHSQSWACDLATAAATWVWAYQPHSWPLQCNSHMHIMGCVRILRNKRAVKLYHSQASQTSSGLVNAACAVEQPRV